jgi:hypothetical protein
VDDIRGSLILAKLTLMGTCGMIASSRLPVSGFLRSAAVCMEKNPDGNKKRSFVFTREKN